MGWRDKFRRKPKADKSAKPKEDIYLINGIDLSLQEANGYGEIASVTIRGGSEEDRDMLSTALMALVMPHYRYDMSTTSPDEHTDSITFRAPGMQSLDGGPIKESAAPVLTLDALKTALEHMEQKVNLRELE